MSLKLISLDKWLSYFHSPQISYGQFIIQAKVYTIDGDIPIKSFRHPSYGKISETHLRLLYDKIVTEKLQYLTNFYHNNLSVVQQTPMPDLPLVVNNNQNPQYKTLVRNLYYKDILLRTQYKKKT